MIRQLARWLSGVGLHWFYGDLRVEGSEHIPREGPILVAMNHQNALVDAMIALWAVPRELRITAKATLGHSLPGAIMMKAVGIIPLSRASDSAVSSDPVRNRHSFEAIINELRGGGAVLIFPEGKSHNDPEIASLKTGLARAALRAREAGVRNVRIVPVGTTFESKSEPDTTVLVQVGEPIAVDDWPDDNAHRLTDTVMEHLRDVSLTGRIHAGARPQQIHQRSLMRLAAWWGRTMHEIPLRIARRRAIRASADVGETAMYTMTLGFVAILASYVIEVSIVWTLLGWIIALVFLGSLIAGAYRAAYSDHLPKWPRK